MEGSRITKDGFGKRLWRKQNIGRGIMGFFCFLRFFFLHCIASYFDSLGGLLAEVGWMEGFCFSFVCFVRSCEEWRARLKVFLLMFAILMKSRSLFIENTEVAKILSCLVVPLQVTRCSEDVPSM